MAALCRVAATPHNRHGNVSEGMLLARRFSNLMPSVMNGNLIAVTPQR